MSTKKKVAAIVITTVALTAGTVWLDVQPKIIDFWEDVLHYRSIGIQELIDKKENKKTKRIKLKNDKDNKQNKPNIPKKVKKQTPFEIDQAIVDKMQGSYLIMSDDE